jgi:hypothetical protein
LFVAKIVPVVYYLDSLSAMQILCKLFWHEKCFISFASTSVAQLLQGVIAQALPKPLSSTPHPLHYFYLSIIFSLSHHFILIQHSPLAKFMPWCYQLFQSYFPITSQTLQNAYLAANFGQSFAYLLKLMRGVYMAACFLRFYL